MKGPPAQLYTYGNVHLGFWTDWSRGKIYGATLTVSRRNGGLLTAFLALFVTVVGVRFWRIGCFLIHRCFSSERERDALCHQRQAILRNAADSTSGLWALLHACRAWKRSGIAPYRRFLPSALFAVLTSMAFFVATVFSSEITNSMGREVLLRGSNCGSLIKNASGDNLTVIGPYVSQRTALSLTYAQQCYNHNVNPQDCSNFYKPRLRWTVDRNTTCPFPGGNDICLSSSSNLRLDTGYIDSDSDLGMNSPPGAKFLYRSVVDCAPLKTEGYTRNTTYEQVSPYEGYAEQKLNRTVMQYLYGLVSDMQNFTYQYAVDELMGPLFHNGVEASASADYTLEAVGSYSAVNVTLKKEASTFDPIPALQAYATDVTLFFLSTNGIDFTEPCDDPWYSAHHKTPVYSHEGSVANTSDPSHYEKEPVRVPIANISDPSHYKEEPKADISIPPYYGDEPVRVLGCLERYEFCNPNHKIGHLCTPLAGIFTATAAAESLWETDEQRKLFNISSNLILTGAGGLLEITSFTGVSSLLARHRLTYGQQGSLPDNQWQLEVENWFGATMADLQRAMVEYVTGPSDPAMFPFLDRPQTDEERLMCQSLKIRSDSVTSFSVLGLSILFGVGGLLIIVSMTLAPLATQIDKRFGRGNHNRLEWAINDTLQLQRLAHEELGCGTWIAEGFPITAPGEKLAVLDVSDPAQPKLVNPASTAKPTSTINSYSVINSDSTAKPASIISSDSTETPASTVTSISEMSAYTENATYFEFFNF